MKSGIPSAEDMLVDTTYLLPLFGVSLKLPHFKRLFPKLVRNNNLHYNPASLIEAKWVILKLARRNPRSRRRLLESYVQGLILLEENGAFKPLPLTSPEVEEESDRLLEEGVEDYFDRLLYATAAVHEMVLLTEDLELHRKWGEDENRGRRRPKRVVRWSDVVEEFR